MQGPATKGRVSLQGLCKAYGGVVALKDVSLEVSPGEFVTLLGPSGCGKTTLLRLIAGFEAVDQGRVLISDRDLTSLPPYRRPVNTVFQHYALFPHRSVAGNVAFGLEAQGLGRGKIASCVSRALEVVRLLDLGDRRVDQLSGGQRQRVALARAIVLEPEVLLLDEPMSALDLKLRKEMQAEVKGLQRRLGITFIFVTHDQDEALNMSDRIAVMNKGSIEQTGTPEDLYERPRTRFVADFLAVRNILQAEVLRVEDGLASLRTLEGLLVVAKDDGGYRPGSSIWIGARPERLSLDGDGENRLPGVIEEGTYLGDHTDWRVALGGERLIVAESVKDRRGRTSGDQVIVSFPATAVLRMADSDLERGR